MPEFSSLARVASRLFGEDICRVTIADGRLVLRVVGTVREGAGVPLRGREPELVVLDVPVFGVRARAVRRGAAARLWTGRKRLGRGPRRHTLFFQPSIERTIVLDAQWQRGVTARFLSVLGEFGGRVVPD